MRKADKPCQSLSRRQMMIGTAEVLAAGTALTQLGANSEKLFPSEPLGQRWTKRKMAMALRETRSGQDC